ncbi:MAG: DUF1186 domain-containing protein [Caldithrix sp.]|nr:MAG: DUF1186 domain-containing protein [Caldithrix sp.]
MLEGRYLGCTRIGGQMKQGGKLKLDQLIKKFRLNDNWIDQNQIDELLSFGSKVVPHLEKILADVNSQRHRFDVKIPPKNPGWFVPLYSLYLLAHLGSEDSLDTVLEFLSQKQETLDYWLHDFLNEDIWEVTYLLGGNQLEKLQEFVLNKELDCFARLAVCTALIQTALNFQKKKRTVSRIFTELLKSENEDSEFIGLLVSELMDLQDQVLKPLMLKALETNVVWSGIISSGEVNSGFKKKCTRRIVPLDLPQRVEHFKQYAYRSTTSSRTSRQEKRRILEESL